MKHTNLMLALLAFPIALSAREDSVPLSFARQTQEKGVELVREDGNEILRITASGNDRGNFHLLDIEAPPVTGSAFAIAGEIRCEGVTSTGYLEMWTHLPAEEGGTEIATSFFSRTLSPTGPMRHLAGNQGWRDFQLPAHINDGSGRRPLQLTLNTHLPEAGVVEIRDLRLIPSIPVPNSAGFGLFPFVLIGVLALLGLAGLFVVLFLWIKKRKTATELSRIRNLDSV